jgi:hypothetical protein
MKSQETLRLPLAKKLKSNNRGDVIDHLEELYDELDRAHKRMVDDIKRLATGTAVGQMLYWDGSNWVATTISELVYDATNVRIGINKSSPTSALDVNETVTVKRLLAGGVYEM